MNDDDYRGRERRRFRRIERSYPVRIEPVSTSADGSALVTDGVTVNISFGGALVDLITGTDLHAAAQEARTPVRVRFVEKGRVSPEVIAGEIWGRGGGRDEIALAVEFEAPLLSYDGAKDLADRLQRLDKLGGQDFARDIVELFLDTVPDALRRVRDSQLEGDLEAVAQIARSLKSSAGNIGAVNLYEVARRAEQAALQGDAEASGRHVNVLQAYFDATKRALEDEV